MVANSTKRIGTTIGVCHAPLLRVAEVPALCGMCPTACVTEPRGGALWSGGPGSNVQNLAMNLVGEI